MIIAGCKLWEIFKTLITGGAIFYAMVLLYFGLFQTRLIYFPSRDLTASPTDIGLDYKDIFFKSADGLLLHGWFIPAQKAKGALLFCHGNAGNISGRLESLAIFNGLGLNVFLFDYRGYGRSEGRVSEKGTYLDVAAAWNYLLHDRKIPAEDIIVFGRSLGASIACHIARENTPGALIIESAFTSIKDIGVELYPYLPVKLLARFEYNTKEYIRGVKCPILIIHSRDDEMMPFHHGRELFEIAEESGEFLEISGSHNDGFIVSGRHYTEGVDSFLRRKFKKKNGDGS